MELTPDAIVVARWGPVTLNATIVYTWAVMTLLVAGSWLITRRLTRSTDLTPGQNMLEIIVQGLRDQIHEISQQRPDRYLPFVGTLFIFIAVSNLLLIVPGYRAPTGSLSTTAALALAVFVAVPVYGITQRGLRSYLRQYMRPTPIMLPFNIIGEVSRTLALAVRLFGNIMSGTMIAAILLAVAPLFFPILISALGLLTGLIQAYIFAVLAMVYIASSARAQDEQAHAAQAVQGEGSHG
jgi:F-type H+-transporting ATPase subunit a